MGGNGRVHWSLDELCLLGSSSGLPPEARKLYSPQPQADVLNSRPTMGWYSSNLDCNVDSLDLACQPGQNFNREVGKQAWTTVSSCCFDVQRFPFFLSF